MEGEKRLSAKGWLGLFALSVLLLALGLAVFNAVTDPFGVFGDRFFTWWSYDETNNPRTAKFSYLEQHHEEYDSYIIGCSSTSSFPTEALNKYFDASFYNYIMYGADMLDVEQLSRYLVKHYEVKNLVVNVYLDNGRSYDQEVHPLTNAMPWKAAGTSALGQYARFLFANPAYGVEKLKKLRTDGFLQAEYDVFDEKSGAYDKSRRDVEPIGSLEDYLAAYPEFADYPYREKGVTLPATEQCMESVAAIRDLCREAGVNLVVVTAPVYYDYLMAFDREAVEGFYTALAEVTPYWDFSVSSVSREPRYFYDATHFRNCVGNMALARMAGDGEVYVPPDFGTYVTAGNAAEHTAGFWSVEAPDERDYTAQVPILLYHNLAQEGDGGDTMTPGEFEGQIAALREAGFQTVTFAQLRDYVVGGKPLPERPVVITFDDGYDSNRTLAAPILEKYGMTATVFMIGVSIGKDTYKDTGVVMTPHFSMDQAAQLEAAGVMEMGSHGYDLHEVAGRDDEPLRQGAVFREGETEEAFVDFFREDCRRMDRLFQEGLGRTVGALAYPYGNYTLHSEVLAAQEGIYATVTIQPRGNTLVKGAPQSLRAMGRYSINGTMTGEEVVALARGENSGGR